MSKRLTYTVIVDTEQDADPDGVQDWIENELYLAGNGRPWFRNVEVLVGDEDS